MKYEVLGWSRGKTRGDRSLSVNASGACSRTHRGSDLLYAVVDALRAWLTLQDGQMPQHAT